MGNPYSKWEETSPAVSIPGGGESLEGRGAGAEGTNVIISYKKGKEMKAPTFWDLWKTSQRTPE